MSAPAPNSTSTPAVDRCWSRIGVWGDRSCVELPKYEHCRHCPVFAAAGRSLFERSVSENYLREFENALRHPEKRPGQSAPTLVFRVGREWLALPAASVASVTEQRAVHRLPHRTGKILAGLVNIEGELHLAFNLRALFNLTETTPPNVALSRRVYPRLILCRVGADAFAFAVDEVYGISTHESANAQPLPAAASPVLATFARGQFLFQERSINLLDDELLAHSLIRQHLG